MGYTHYWQQRRSFNQDEMLAIGEVVRGIVDTAMDGRKVSYGYPEEHEHPIVICNGWGDRGSRPQIDDKAISLNGMGPDLDHETFNFGREIDGSFTFCKTARKPYDIVVVAILAYLAAKWDFEVSSDGGVEDWEAGVALAQEVTGEPIPNPLIVEALVN